jgi:hypothetical protein
MRAAPVALLEAYWKQLEAKSSVDQRKAFLVVCGQGTDIRGEMLIQRSEE